MAVNRQFYEKELRISTFTCKHIFLINLAVYFTPKSVFKKVRFRSKGPMLGFNVSKRCAF